jgi:sulfur-oxidizing protein SoxX
VKPIRRNPGLNRSRWKRLARSAINITGTWLMAATLAMSFAANAQELRPHTISGDAITESLTGKAGEPVRGRALVVERASTCILCHSGPFPEEKFQGDLAPNLTGSGKRWSEGQLRLRLVNASRLNPATIMPSYYRVDGLERVGPAWRGKPILSAEQIEDIVAYLATLRE